MDAPGVSLRPKRLRRDVSPTKLSPGLDKSPTKCEPQCSTGEDKTQDKPSTVTNSPAAGITVKRNLAPKKWTLPEKMIFFEGVRQHGRCFLKISKLFEQKSKNKPEIQLRDTGQCRYFFTRSIKRLCLFPQINLDSGVRKKYMEILALVNYGEILRKTEREINKRTAENLNEMIYKGSTVMKMPGRVVRVKTPMCPVVKRFMKKKDMCSFIHLPQVVTMEFSPRKCIDHSMLRSATMSNPYTRLTVPITKTFAATLKLIESKVRNHAFQRFKHLAGTSELVEPKLIFNLNPHSVAQVNFVEETDKVYTPSSFNGVEEMLAHGIGLTKEVTETATTSAKISQGINLSVQLNGDCVVYSSSSVSPGTSQCEQPGKTKQQTDTIQNGKNDSVEPEIVYITNVKCASSIKQYVRHSLDSSANVDGFYSYLRECFCLESIPTDLTMAKLLVIMKVPPIVQIEYAMNIDPLEISVSHKLNPDIDAIINIGLMVSQSKRSQTPVMGSTNHAHDNDSTVQSNLESGIQRKSSTEGPSLGRIGAASNCPIPGSSEDTQLQDHIMMLQSSGKVRLRNRLKFSQFAVNHNESNLTNNTFMNDPTNDLSNHNPQRRLPKIAPKLFNQITGSISVGPNNNISKIILGNHTNGQRLPTIADNGAFSTCNPRSNFINIPFNNAGALQPIQLTQNQLETTFTNPAQHDVPLDSFPSQFRTPAHENHCMPDILDVAMKTAQVPQGNLQTANPNNLRQSQQMTSVLPPLSEILPPTNDMISSTGNGLVTSSLAQQQCSPVISGSSNLPRSQVQLLPGCLSSTQTFDASSDSFLSRRLDGEIEEMLNDNSVDVANKFDALLNSTESVLT